jgi:hypothetical protein
MEKQAELLPSMGGNAFEVAMKILVSPPIIRNWHQCALTNHEDKEEQVAEIRMRSPPMMKTALQVSGRPSLSLMVGSNMPYLTEISRVGSAMMGKSIVILFSQWATTSSSHFLWLDTCTKKIG